MLAGQQAPLSMPLMWTSANCRLSSPSGLSITATPLTLAHRRVEPERLYERSLRSLHDLHTGHIAPLSERRRGAVGVMEVPDEAVIELSLLDPAWGANVGSLKVMDVLMEHSNDISLMVTTFCPVCMATAPM